MALRSRFLTKIGYRARTLWSALAHESTDANSIQRNKLQLHGVIRVVSVISHAVRRFHNLHLQKRQQPRRPRTTPPCRPASPAFEYFVGQIQSRKGGISRFQFLSQRQGKLIVRKPAVIGQAFVQCVLSGMAKWRMAESWKRARASIRSSFSRNDRPTVRAMEATSCVCVNRVR